MAENHYCDEHKIHQAAIEGNEKSASFACKAAKDSISKGLFVPLLILIFTSIIGGYSFTYYSDKALSTEVRAHESEAISDYHMLDKRIDKTEYLFNTIDEKMDEMLEKQKALHKTVDGHSKSLLKIQQSQEKIKKEVID